MTDESFVDGRRMMSRRLEAALDNMSAETRRHAAIAFGEMDPASALADLYAALGIEFQLCQWREEAIFVEFKADRQRDIDAQPVPPLPTDDRRVVLSADGGLDYLPAQADDDETPPAGP